jgi:4-hydroxy-4-methyl-2-oxoglutarate aldolase
LSTQEGIELTITHAPRSDNRDLSLVDRLQRLYVAVVSDCLDRVGIRDNVMAPHIRPLFSCRTAGFAATVHAILVDRIPTDHSLWYAGEIAAVDAQETGDVMVVSTCNGSYWGELLATASRARGARGIVADAYTRDTSALEAMAYPTFVAGISAKDSLGRLDVDEIGSVIECGGVTVSNGDLILADQDGIVVVPYDAADEVLRLAEAKVATEDTVRAELKRGVPVCDVFATYGTL